MISALAFFISFVVALAAVPSVIKVASHCRLLDVPDHRKRHERPVPSLAGVAVFGSLLLSTSIIKALFGSGQLAPGLLAAVVVLFFVGCKDDLIGMSAKRKLLAQAVATTLVVLSDDLLLTELGGLIPLQGYSPAIALAATLLPVLLVVNALNLIDGIDGLCSSIGCSSGLLFAVLFALHGQLDYSVYAAVLSGSCFAVLFFNWRPARIFLGDSGSLVIGLLLAVFCLKYYSVGGSSSIFGTVRQPFLICLCLALVYVPVLDTVRVFGTRILSGKSPFAADRTHIHHILLDQGLSVPAIVGVVLIAHASALSFALVGIFTKAFTGWLVVGFLVVGYLCFVQLLKFCSSERVSVKPVTAKAA